MTPEVPKPRAIEVTELVVLTIRIPRCTVRHSLLLCLLRMQWIAKPVLITAYNRVGVVSVESRGHPSRTSSWAKELATFPRRPPWEFLQTARVLPVGSMIKGVHARL